MQRLLPVSARQADKRRKNVAKNREKQKSLEPTPGAVKWRRWRLALAAMLAICRSDLVQISLVGGLRLPEGGLSVWLRISVEGRQNAGRASRVSRGRSPDWGGERFDGEFPDDVEELRLHMTLLRHNAYGGKEKSVGEGEIALRRETLLLRGKCPLDVPMASGGSVRVQVRVVGRSSRSQTIAATFLQRAERRRRCRKKVAALRRIRDRAVHRAEAEARRRQRAEAGEREMEARAAIAVQACVRRLLARRRANAISAARRRTAGEAGLRAAAAAVQRGSLVRKVVERRPGGLLRLLPPSLLRSLPGHAAPRGRATHVRFVQVRAGRMLYGAGSGALSCRKGFGLGEVLKIEPDLAELELCVLATSRRKPLRLYLPDEPHVLLWAHGLLQHCPHAVVEPALPVTTAVGLGERPGPPRLSADHRVGQGSLTGTRVPGVVSARR